MEERSSTQNGGGWGTGIWGIPNFPYNNLQAAQTIFNPLAPPLRDERFIMADLAFVQPPLLGRVPINVAVNAVDTNYRQMGILTPLNNKTENNILQLMGRPLYVRRSKYQYYAISNQHNNVKLPLIVKGRNALNDNGVDELFSGDNVFVEGYNQPFKVTKYENDTIKYLPFI